MQKDIQKLMTSVQSRQSINNDELTCHSSDIVDELTDLLKKKKKKKLRRRSAATVSSSRTLHMTS